MSQSKHEIKRSDSRSSTTLGCDVVEPQLERDPKPPDKEAYDDDDAFLVSFDVDDPANPLVSSLPQLPAVISPPEQHTPTLELVTAPQVVPHFSKWTIGS